MRIIHKLSTLFYIGYAKTLPGTLASFISTVFLYLIFYYIFNATAYFIILGIFFILSVLICHLANKYIFSESDSRKIVLDESFGVYISFFPFIIYQAFPIALVMLNFMLFRFFDIVKPFPISYIDNHYKNGLGIVLDDALAGILSGSIVYLIVWIQNNSYY